MSFDKNQLQDLYSSGLSMMDIAKKEGVSLHKVAYWIKKYKITPRTRSEAGYVKLNPTGDPFKITPIDNIEKRELMALGIALFLGEGTKKEKFGVKLANSDPKIINIFLNFLNKICGVKINKIKAWINLFDDNLYPETLKYWSLETGIPKENFYSPIIRQRKTGSYKNKSKYGTITVIVGNKKLLELIMSWCNKYLQKYADMAQW